VPPELPRQTYLVRGFEEHAKIDQPSSTGSGRTIRIVLLVLGRPARASGGRIGESSHRRQAAAWSDQTIFGRGILDRKMRLAMGNNTAAPWAPAVRWRGAGQAEVRLTSWRNLPLRVFAPAIRPWRIGSSATLTRAGFLGSPTRPRVPPSSWASYSTSRSRQEPSSSARPS